MSGKMDWRRAHLHGRPTLDFRSENDIPDRAARWLRAVDRSPAAPRDPPLKSQDNRRQAQRRQRPRERTFRPTQTSSAGPPW
jgi:hypothetical protein